MDGCQLKDAAKHIQSNQLYFGLCLALPETQSLTFDVADDEQSPTKRPKEMKMKSSSASGRQEILENYENNLVFSPTYFHHSPRFPALGEEEIQ